MPGHDHMVCPYIRPSTRLFFFFLLHLALLQALEPEQVHPVIVLDSMDVRNAWWHKIS